MAIVTPLSTCMCLISLVLCSISLGVNGAAYVLCVLT
jgi:hypothetical protein